MKLSTGLKLALLALGVLLLYSSAMLRAQKTTMITVCPAGPPDCHFQKIQDAINVALEGSTIQVKPGTYAENLTIIYKHLTLQGESRDQVTIQGAVAILFTKNVTMSSFTVKGGRTIYIEDSTGIVLKDNVFVEMAKGVFVRNSSITIQGNLVSKSGSHGISLVVESVSKAKKSSIIGNEIADSLGDGVNVSGALIEMRNNIIMGNIGDGVKMIASQADIRDNTIASNIGYGVWVDDDKSSKITGKENNMCNWTGILGGEATFSGLKDFWMPLPIQLRILTGHTDEVESVTFGPYGCFLASGSGVVKVWDVIKGSEVRTLSEHPKPIKAVAFSPTGKLLASGSWDNTIKVWDVGTGKEVCTLSDHTKPINSVAFSPDGKLLASGSDDDTIKLWELEDVVRCRSPVKVKHMLAGHGGPVKTVAFHPNGKLLASGSADNTIKLWDAVNGKEPQTLSGHDGDVNSVAFSPDGRLLASGSADKTVRLWDVSRWAGM